MPSEFAKMLNFELDARAPQRRSVEVIDAELQEVREVLSVSARREIKDARDAGPCWCKSYLPTLGHTEDCLRARALYRRLTPAAQDAAGER